MVTVGVAPVAMVTLKNAVLSAITLNTVQPYLCMLRRRRGVGKREGEGDGREEVDKYNV